MAHGTLVNLLHPEPKKYLGIPKQICNVRPPGEKSPDMFVPVPSRRLHMPCHCARKRNESTPLLRDEFYWEWGWFLPRRRAHPWHDDSSSRTPTNSSHGTEEERWVKPCKKVDVPAREEGREDRPQFVARARISKRRIHLWFCYRSAFVCLRRRA